MNTLVRFPRVQNELETELNFMARVAKTDLLPPAKATVRFVFSTSTQKCPITKARISNPSLKTGLTRS